MPKTVFDIPHKFLAFADRGEYWSTWLAELPALTSHLIDEWSLVVDGVSTHGECALVVPVRTSDDVPAVLKVGWPHEEAEHEHLALRFWDGKGAARLLRADPHRSALLLERLHTRDLTTVPDVEACEVIADLYADLHRPASAEFRTLSSLCERWAPRLDAIASTARLPRRFVNRAARLAREFAVDPATDGTIIHTDLHYDNVLASDRGPWLAIDPKPLSGDPAYEVAPLLWNRWDEVATSSNVRAAIRRRFEAVVDAAGLDEERAKGWVVLRMTVNAMWEIEDPSPPSDAMENWLTDSVTISKAMDD